MIKVECVSCKAPYELDERRIPEKGMKMRCPKCGTSFGVTKHGVSSDAGAAAPPRIAPPPPIAPPPAVGAAAVPKGTMLGMQAPPAIAVPFSPSTEAKHKTAFGVAPAAAPPPPASMPKGSLAPLPAQGPGVPVRAPVAPPPPSVPQPAPSAAKSAAAKGAFGATMLGAAIAPKVSPPASAPDGFGVELPADLPPAKPAAEPQDLSVSRIYVEDESLHMDIGRGGVVKRWPYFGEFARGTGRFGLFSGRCDHLHAGRQTRAIGRNRHRTESAEATHR